MSDNHDGWTKAWSEDHQSWYWFNNKTQQSVWDADFQSTSFSHADSTEQDWSSPRWDNEKHSYYYENKLTGEVEYVKSDETPMHVNPHNVSLQQKNENTEKEIVKENTEKEIVKENTEKEIVNENTEKEIVKENLVRPLPPPASERRDPKSANHIDEIPRLKKQLKGSIESISPKSSKIVKRQLEKRSINGDKNSTKKTVPLLSKKTQITSKNRSPRTRRNPQHFFADTSVETKRRTSSLSSKTQIKSPDLNASPTHTIDKLNSSKSVNDFTSENVKRISTDDESRKLAWTNKSSTTPKFSPQLHGYSASKSSHATHVLNILDTLEDNMQNLTPSSRLASSEALAQTLTHHQWPAHNPYPTGRQEYISRDGIVPKPNRVNNTSTDIHTHHAWEVTTPAAIHESTHHHEHHSTSANVTRKTQNRNHPQYNQEEWTSFWDPKESAYYFYNNNTGRTVWELPHTPVHSSYSNTQNHTPVHSYSNTQNHHERTVMNTTQQNQNSINASPHSNQNSINALPHSNPTSDWIRKWDPEHDCHYFENKNTGETKW